jgi:hypothetical protein
MEQNTTNSEATSPEPTHSDPNHPNTKGPHCNFWGNLESQPHKSSWFLELSVILLLILCVFSIIQTKRAKKEVSRLQTTIVQIESQKCKGVTKAVEYGWAQGYKQSVWDSYHNSNLYMITDGDKGEATLWQKVESKPEVKPTP